MSQNLDILVLAPTGRDGPLLCEMLGRRCFACRAYTSVTEVCRGIAAGVGAVVITEEALGDGGMEELNTAVEAQPPWSDVAFVLLTSNADRVQAAVQALLRRRKAATMDMG